MKEINELYFPEDLHYAEDHEWARQEGKEKIRVGISDYAQDQLGDIVFVELPQIGKTVNKGEEFGTIESVKAVAELYMPLSGEILAVNPLLADSPELLNKDPYNQGWLLEVKPKNQEEIDTLMTKDRYVEMLKGKA